MPRSQAKMKSSAANCPDHLREIGLITVNFAMLEWLLKLRVHHLLETDIAVGRIVTAELSFRGVIDLLSSLVRARLQDPAALNELRRLLGRIAEVEGKRNQITHSLWGVPSPEDPEDTSVSYVPFVRSNGDELVQFSAIDKLVRMKTTAKRTDGIREHSQEMSVQELHNIADQIAVVAYDAEMFFGRADRLLSANEESQ